jgi:hypothetical protein
VATDPFVAPELDDLPRQQPNLAPGVTMPAAVAWRADRPGDLEAGQPTGALLGRPGPNVGYALALAQRVRDRITLAPHESADDSLAVISELAMRRAVAFGRAPVMADIDAACLLLGYKGDTTPDFVDWRSVTVHGASHDYPRRRRVVDAVPEAVLRLPPQVPDLLAEFRAELRDAIAD